MYCLRINQAAKNILVQLVNRSDAVCCLHVLLILNSCCLGHGNPVVLVASDASIDSFAPDSNQLP